MAIRTDHVRITTNDPETGRHCVKIGDVDISNAVGAAHVHIRPADVPEVTLTFFTRHASAVVDGPATVEIDEDTAFALVELGWSPPAPAAELTEEQPAALIEADAVGELWLTCGRCRRPICNVEHGDWLTGLAAAVRIHTCPEQDGEQAEAGQ